MRSVVVAICLIMLVGLAQPAMAQAGTGKEFEPLPIGPDNSTFTVHAKIHGAIESGCTISLAELNEEYPGGEVPVMVNDPDDPCVTDEHPNDRHNFATHAGTSFGLAPRDAPDGFPKRPSQLPEEVPYPNGSAGFGGEQFTIYSAMNVPPGASFVEGSRMGGVLYLWIESAPQVQGTAPNVAGLEPRVSLALGDEVLATWKGEGNAVTQLDPIASTEPDRRYFRFDVEWGEVPATTDDGGSLRVVIRFAGPEESIGVVTGISTEEAHRSSFTVPFETVSPPVEDGGSGGSVETGSEPTDGAGEPAMAPADGSERTPFMPRLDLVLMPLFLLATRAAA